MGSTKGPYREEFPVGTRVQIAEIARLREFQSTWKHHHPLQTEQLAFAGALGEVAEVSFYHGGDELYRVEGVPGLWHEVLLSGAADSE